MYNRSAFCFCYTITGDKTMPCSSTPDKAKSKVNLFEEQQVRTAWDDTVTNCNRLKLPAPDDLNASWNIARIGAALAAYIELSTT
jgi:hypothetical protein